MIRLYLSSYNKNYSCFFVCFLEVLMKLIDIYKMNKEKYNKYIIMIKCGYFYEIYGIDAYIMNKIFGYKLKEVSSSIRVGFPVNSYNKVTNKLNNLKINYIIINENIKVKFKDNNYSKYERYFKNNCKL